MKIPYIMLVIAIVGGLVGFLAGGHPVLVGLGKAIFGVFFSLSFITGLVGTAEEDHLAQTGRKS